MKNATYFVDGIKDYLIHELWNLNADIIDAAEEGDLIRRDVVFTEIDTLDNLCMQPFLRESGIHFTICAAPVSAENFENLDENGIINVPQFYLTYANAEKGIYAEYKCGRYKEKGE